ncbi:MAG: hypothetical protein UR96_C0047G0009 [candidate division WS6 bacterium GW2011_GWC1_36_11]|uniref:Uncharacterized protein n=1 Tax=candidate division WS6 bacterium GW2011_GWC1_36_11 TaxID=1619090 RepID=A0A0G0D739_9BACT|nr:MAG: hypothetical protein UR96_C0047G0009 [candidate division WS6 bacterium GW2011_GWC1_36_11]
MPEREVQINTDNIYYDEPHQCVVNKGQAYDVINAALQEFKKVEGGFFEGKKQAEEEYIEFLKSQNETDEFIATALFFLSSVTFGSSSKLFFDSLTRDPEEYKELRWLFIPSEIVKSRLLTERTQKRASGIQKPLPGIGEECNIAEQTIYDKSQILQISDNDGVKIFNNAWHKLIKPKGRQIGAMRGWYYNALTLNDKYEGSIYKYFEKAGDNDAVKIMHAMIDKPSSRSEKKEIVRFRQKLASLYLQWIVRYGLYDLQNPKEFGLPVDFQLCRIAVQTNILDPRKKLRREVLANEVFVPLITELCLENRENGWEPRLVSEALWLIGSQGCTPDQRSSVPNFFCPLNQYCSGVLHKMKNDFLMFVADEIEKKLRLWTGDQEWLTLQSPVSLDVDSD